MSAKPMIPNVLAGRYASVAMTAIWSPEAKIIAERRLWLAVATAQVQLGLDIPEQALSDYRRVVDVVDLTSIAERERVTKHDVKARIEEFNALAGHEHVHVGMTSRDLTENVEQLQVRDATDCSSGSRMRHRRSARLAERAIAEHDTTADHRPLATTSRPRPPPSASASPTPAEELLVALQRARRADRPLPAPRHQGPGRHGSRTCSTCSAAPEGRLARHGGRRWPSTSGSGPVLHNVGQVYPRSLDLDVVSALVPRSARGSVEPRHHACG